MDRIGFMQGRLVDLVDGKIQAFPWDQWQLEFPRAQALGLKLMEWTLDDDRMEDNPFTTAQGQAEIRALMEQHQVRVSSLTGDCFMQKPFWKTGEPERQQLLRKLELVVRSASLLGARFVVVPLVDNGRLESDGQREILVAELLRRADQLRRAGVQIVFETDLAPSAYAEFLRLLPGDVFNVNYDIGNSASLGFDSAEEFSAYGHRIVNVHVKDRILGGTTVPLGTGAADLPKVFMGLAHLGYSGNYILQTARAGDGDHAGALGNYIALTRSLLGRGNGSGSH